jgi:hypothetical protein
MCLATPERATGCRGFAGPVPPPLWMSVQFVYRERMVSHSSPFVKKHSMIGGDTSFGRVDKVSFWEIIGACDFVPG